MSLIQSIKRVFTKSCGAENWEVDPEKFYSELLNQEDAQRLQSFVSDFTWRLSIPSAILAVGSSVYPKQYFESRRKINLKDPIAKANESYNDIDLLVVPETVVGLAELEKSVQEVLNSLRFKWKSHETTPVGVSYHEQDDGTYCPFLHVDYSLHSIETNLKNGTKLDLILGRGDLLEQTADQKIAEERNKNYAFSLLYKK